MLYEPRQVAEELGRKLGMVSDMAFDEFDEKLNADGSARAAMCMLSLLRNGISDYAQTDVVSEIARSFRKDGIGWRLPIHMSMAILERLVKGDYPSEYYIMAVTGNTMEGFDSFWEEFGDTVVTEDFVEQYVEMPSLPWQWKKYAWVVGWPVHGWQQGDEWHVRVRTIVAGDIEDTVVMFNPEDYEGLLKAVGPLEVTRPMMGIPIGITCEVVRSPTLYYAKTWWAWWDRGPSFGDWVYEPDGYDMGEWQNPQDEMIGVGYWGGVTERWLRKERQPQVFVYLSSGNLTINMLGLGKGYGFLLGRRELTYDLFSQTAAMVSQVKHLAGAKTRRGVKAIMDAINSKNERLEYSLRQRGETVKLWDAAWIVAAQGRGGTHYDQMQWARKAGEVLLLT